MAQISTALGWIQGEDLIAGTLQHIADAIRAHESSAPAIRALSDNVELGLRLVFGHERVNAAHDAMRVEHGEDPRAVKKDRERNQMRIYEASKPRFVRLLNRGFKDGDEQ